MKETKQFYSHYLHWEDWQNGMYEMPNKEREDGMQEKAISVLQNPFNAMLSVITEWPICTAHNFTKQATNKKSWLGQAACCYEYGIPEHITRSVWNKLTEEERINANNVADQIIELWQKSA